MSRNPNVTILTPEEYGIAKKNGINRNTAVSRVRNLKWSVERAITEKVTKKVVNFTEEELAIMKEHGISEKLARLRLTSKDYKEWTRERAMTQAPREKAHY